MNKLRVVNGFLSCGVMVVALGGYNVYAEPVKAEANSTELFKVLDGNSDGKLTSDEIAPEKSRFFKQLVRRGDGNKDGSLTQDEFVVALNEQPAAKVDGSDSEKGKKGRKKGKGKGKGKDNKRGGRPTPEQIIEKHDADGDGLLSLDEVPERMKKRIEPLLNKLGKEKLSAEDIKQAMEKMKGKGPRGKRPEGDSKRGGKDGKMKKGSKGEGPGKGRGRMGHRPRHPEFEGGLLQELDANDDKQLSQEELKNATEIFSKLDHNEDGQLDMAELMGRPKHGRHHRMGEGEGRKPGEKGAHGKRGGKRGDKKGKGKRSEKGSKGEGKERGNRMIEKLDKDDDGKISKEEAPERMKKHFSKLDKNEDGFITKDELRGPKGPRGKKGKKGKKGEKPEAGKNLGF